MALDQTLLYLILFAGMGVIMFVRMLLDAWHGANRLEVYEIDGKNVRRVRAVYYPEDGIAVRRLGSFMKGVAVKYLVNEKHLLYPFVKRLGFIPSLQPMVLVDVRTRRSVNPYSGRPTGHTVNQLDYLTERNFWLALMTRLKVPVGVWIIGMFMGAGVYSVLRLVLASMGLPVP